MDFVLASALGSGFISGIWTGLANYWSLSMPEYFSAWLGFVGITSFFIAGCGKDGFIHSTVSNVVGIIIGCLIIFICSFHPTIVFGAIVTGAFTSLICYLGRYDLTKFATCTFLGGFSAFATGGDWKLLAVSILCGNVVGYLCEMCGNLIFKLCGKKED